MMLVNVVITVWIDVIFFFQAEDGIRDIGVTGVQTCALPILEEGLQFEEQVTMKDEHGQTIYEEGGHRLIPDVILHFPDNRDVVIDSKMSFKAFEDYHNADNESDREEALHRHLLSRSEERRV